MLGDKPFEQLYKDYLQEAKSFKRAAELSFDTYLEKYATERGKKAKPKTKYFVSGKIYTFQYLSVAVPDKKRPYINSRPVIISMGGIAVGNVVYETGIDLMVVPVPLRTEMLARIMKYFEKPIMDNVKSMLAGRADNRKKILDGTGWQLAYGTFDKTKIKGEKTYDYEDWPSLVALNTKGIRGAGMRTIYDMYIKRISNPPDPLKDIGKI
jgi:hypothetical protein